jgi:hypothetical protein
MTPENAKKLFGYMNSLGLRQPAQLDQAAASTSWAAALAGLSSSSIRRAVDIWAQRNEWWPTAHQLARLARDYQAGEVPALPPEQQVIPHVEKLHWSKYKEYLDEYANGPDDETTDEIWHRMCGWVARNVDAW